MTTYYNGESVHDLTKEGLVIFDFYANWCGPCKMLAPILEELSEEMNFKLVKIDVDTFEDIAREYKVMSIPSVFIYRDEILVDSFVGFKNKEEIKELLSRVIE